MATPTNAIPDTYVPILPDQWNVEKDEEWYRNCVRFWAGQYNPNVETAYTIAKANGSPEGGKQNPTTGRVIDKFVRNMSYYFGDQNNITYAYWVKDVNNSQLPTRLINGQSIFEIIEYRSGFMYDTFVKGMHKRVNVKDNSPDFLSDMNERVSLAIMASELKSAGVDINLQPIPGQEIRSEEQAIAYLKERPMDKVERIFTSVARDFLFSIDYEKSFMKIIQYLNICAFARVEVRVEGDDVVMDIYAPHQCIFDINSKDDFGDDDQGGGVVDYMTIPDLFARYEFNDKEKEQLNQIAKSNSASTAGNLGYPFISSYIGNSGFPYWRWINGVPVVAVIKAWWKGYENGMQKNYMCDYIGNAYVKNFGPQKYMIENKRNKSYVIPRFTDFMPSKFFGKNKSIIDRAFSISDRIDGLEAKLDLFINQAKGSVLIMNGGELPDNTSPKEILSNISTMNFVYLEMDIDDAEQIYGKGKVFSVVDLNVNGQAVNALNQEITRLEGKLKRIAFAPDTVTGQQTPQGSFKEQQGIIDQASYGTSTFYNGFIIYLNRIIQIGTDLRKTLFSLKEADKALQFGTAEIQFVKFLKEWSLKELNVHVDQSDAVTPQDRAEYREMQFAFLQNSQNFQGLGIGDFAAIKMMDSKSEIARYLKEKEAQGKAEAQAREEQQMAREEQQAADANATQLAMTQEQGAVSLENTQLKNQGKLEEKALAAQLSE